MTKDWDAVQDVIKDLSWNQKKPLEEVKVFMEQNHNFTASTRAYRMKLKEWGLLRHLPKKSRANIRTRRSGTTERRDDTMTDRDSSATVEPVSAGQSPAADTSSTGAWQLTSGADLPHAESTFMEIVNQETNLQPSAQLTSGPQSSVVPADIVMDMLGYILDNQSEPLEKLLLENPQHANDPIGMPFETPGSRFYNHPALNRMVILQHPNQKLLDIACGMPSGPSVWILLSYGARGSRHPLGSDLALHNAIKNGRVYTVQALLSPGRSDVNGIPGILWTPLQQAVFWNVPDVLNVLIKRGANVREALPSSGSPGVHTALQLCLERRAEQYSNVAARTKRNEVLKILLNAGADIHVPPIQGSSLSPFEKFIEPWQNSAYWNIKLSCVELDCLGLFVKRGADLRARFFGCPCAAFSSNTFEHQALWHSSPVIAELLTSKFEADAGTNGPNLLHEIIRVCPDSRRHPADTLRYIEALLQRGVDPNIPDATGATPLKKSIERCMAVDLVPQLQALLAGGADPEHEDYDGLQVYTFAAQTLEEPLLSRVMKVLVGGVSGRHIRIVDGNVCTWKPGIFPISDIQTYNKVVSCTKEDGEFMTSMREMVPQDVQPAFKKAYFAIVSESYLEAIANAATCRPLSSQERTETISIISMRNLLGLPEHEFNQGLVVALLDPQSTVAGARTEENTALQIHEPTSALPTTSPAYTPFQFNANPPIPLRRETSPSPSASPERDSDFFIEATTQIRWHDPTSASRPDDLAKATASILHLKCGVCADDTLLTKTELERHEIEHAHARTCEGRGCMRRFCRDSRKRKRGVGGQDELFAVGL